MGVDFADEGNELGVDFAGLGVVMRVGGELEDALEGLGVVGGLLGGLVAITMNDQFIKAYIFRLRRSRSVLYLKSWFRWNLTLLNIKAAQHLVQSSRQRLPLSRQAPLRPVVISCFSRFRPNVYTYRRVVRHLLPHFHQVLV